MLKKLLFFFGILSISLTAQERKPLYGKILDSISQVKNAHIVNLKTKKATATNKSGDFKIFAKVGDSLKVTSVGYFDKIYRVNKVSFGFNDLVIFINKRTYMLDEVDLKNTNLSGDLNADSKKTPKDKKAEALKDLMDFSDIDMNAPVEDDHIDKNVRPHEVRTDPNMAFVGAGVSIGIPFKHSERLWALRKELAFKKTFPARILNELGEEFFFKELKIPVERYYHFLEYCNPLGVEKLYQQKKILDVITILKKEQITYLKIIEKN